MGPITLKTDNSIYGITRGLADETKSTHSYIYISYFIKKTDIFTLQQSLSDNKFS